MVLIQHTKTVNVEAQTPPRPRKLQLLLSFECIGKKYSRVAQVQAICSQHCDLDMLRSGFYASVRKDGDHSIYLDLVLCCRSVHWFIRDAVTVTTLYLDLYWPWAHKLCFFSKVHIPSRKRDTTVHWWHEYVNTQICACGCLSDIHLQSHPLGRKNAMEYWMVVQTEHHFAVAQANSKALRCMPFWWNKKNNFSQMQVDTTKTEDAAEAAKTMRQFIHGKAGVGASACHYPRDAAEMTAHVSKQRPASKGNEWCQVAIVCNNTFWCARHFACSANAWFCACSWMFRLFFPPRLHRMLQSTGCALIVAIPNST